MTDFEKARLGMIHTSLTYMVVSIGYATVVGTLPHVIGFFFGPRAFQVAGGLLCLLQLVFTIGMYRKIMAVIDESQRLHNAEEAARLLGVKDDA